jgi:hypothetical protein
MTRSVRCRTRILSGAAVLVAFATMGAASSAQVTKPFQITGSGFGPMGLPLPGQPARPHNIVGEATHLGRHTGQGTVQTNSAVFHPDTGTFTGDFGAGSPFVFVGANGERLVTWYGRVDHGASAPGHFTLTIVGVNPDGSLVVTAVFVAEFVVQPDLSTGKFAGATGNWIMIAETEPFVLASDGPIAYSWEGEGAITFLQGP